jgi:very-short-patch-repair endonuclease
MGVIRNKRDRLTRHRAHRLRLNDTDAEARLWAALGARRLGGWTWRRQVAFGPYILDFLCREAGLVVELDGGQHGDAEAYDARRTAYLERHGLRVLRFWNSAVLTNREGVCETILAACRPLPPRSGEGEGREWAGS